MQILVFNVGSTTLKFALYEAGPAAPPQPHVQGQISPLGAAATLELALAAGPPQREPVAAADPGAAVEAALVALRAAVPALSPAAVGHRVVHGGGQFQTPTRLTPTVLAALDALSPLAPLHNPPALAGIRAAQAALGPGVPHVAVFDTAFYATLPPVAYTYALPEALVARYSIRRYGFHGLAHAALLAGYCAASGTPLEAATIITLQLGGGCSATAIRAGQAVDTSMGFTPLEGLVMGTRAGDLDPALPAFLARQTGATLAELDQLLNHEAGLRGVGGGSGDMRELLARRTSDPRAALAVALFCYRARKYIGAYLAVLGGAQAVVFGGGIGEHAPAIRTEICAGLEWAGLEIDPARNQAATDGAARISADAARIRAYVVPVEEAATIATATVACVLGADRG